MNPENKLLLYRLADIAGHTKPERIVDTIDGWTTVISRVPIDLQRVEEVVEIGPGWSPKIQFVLKELGYGGRLKIIDLNSRALQIQKQIGNFIKPEFALALEQGDFFDLTDGSTSLMVANHFIDDLIAGIFAKEKGKDYELIFADFEKQTKFWEEIVRDISFIDSLVERTSEKIFQTLNPQGTFITNTYTSNFDSKYGVENREQVCIHFMNLLKQATQDKGTVYNVNVTNNWLVFKK